jgi:predicted esterase
MSDTTKNAFGFFHRFEPASAGSSETLLLLHGTGGDESDLIDIGRQLAPHAALLSPRGKISENGAARFFRRLREGVFDLEDLKHRAGELADFIVAAAGAYKLDQRKICAVGFSNGANIAGAVMLLRPEVLRHAALLRPMVPLHPAQSPDLTGHKVLVAAGRADPMVSAAQTAELVQLLQKYGAEVKLSTASAGHHLTATDLEAVSSWLGTLDQAVPWRGD